MASTTKVKVPQFDSVNKSYEFYVKEIKYWQKLSKLEKGEQAVLLAYNLPDDDPSGIKEKLFLELDLDVLSADNGVEKFLEYMDGIFLKDDLTKTYMRTMLSLILTKEIMIQQLLATLMNLRRGTML